MKSSVFIFLILFGVFEKSYGTKLKCEFQDIRFSVGTLYSCFVSSLDNINNDMIITGYSGIHQPNKTDTEVKVIWIYHTNTKFIPMNLGLLFNLTVLGLSSTQLIEIKSQDFKGMQNLEELYLLNNNLISVPIDSFFTLPKLKQIGLGWNQIEELQNGIFANNLELKTIHLRSNKIKFIGSNLFDGLKKLDKVNLKDNSCINKRYRESKVLFKLKKRISLKCKSPNDPTTKQDLIYMQQKITKLEAKILMINKIAQEMEKMNVEFYDRKSQLMYKHRAEMEQYKTLTNQLKEEEKEFCKC